MSRIKFTWHDCTETNDDECNLKIDSENMILLQNDEDLKKPVNIVIELQNIFQIMARVLTQCSDEWAIEKYHIM